MQSQNLALSTRTNYSNSLRSIITTDKLKLQPRSLSVFPVFDPELKTKGTSTDQQAMKKWCIMLQSQVPSQPVVMPKPVVPKSVLPPKMKLKSSSFAEQQPNRKQPAVNVPVKKKLSSRKPTEPSVKPAPTTEPTAAASDTQITSLVIGDSEEKVQAVLDGFSAYMESKAGGRLASSTRHGYKTDAKCIITNPTKFNLPVGLSVLSSTVSNAVKAVSQDHHSQSAWTKFQKYLAWTVTATIDDDDDDDDDAGSEAICAICQTDDDSHDIILCDAKGCGQGFHLRCLTPALSSVPAGNWECQDCKPPAPVPSFKVSPSPMRKKVQVNQYQTEAAALEQKWLETTAALQADLVRARSNSPVLSNGVRGSVLSYNSVQGWGWIRLEGSDRTVIVMKQEHERFKSLPGWKAACAADKKGHELADGVFFVEFDLRKSHSGGGMQAVGLRLVTERNEEKQVGSSAASDWLGSAYPDADKMTDSEPGWNDGSPREAVKPLKEPTLKKVLENEAAMNTADEKPTPAAASALEDEPLLTVQGGKGGNKISAAIRQQFQGRLDSIEKPNLGFPPSLVISPSGSDDNDTGTTTSLAGDTDLTRSDTVPLSEADLAEQRSYEEINESDSDSRSDTVPLSEADLAEQAAFVNMFEDTSTAATISVSEDKGPAVAAVPTEMNSNPGQSLSCTRPLVAASAGGDKAEVMKVPRSVMANADRKRSFYSLKAGIAAEITAEMAADADASDEVSVLTQCSRIVSLFSPYLARSRSCSLTIWLHMTYGPSYLGIGLILTSNGRCFAHVASAQAAAP